MTATMTMQRMSDAELDFVTGCGIWDDVCDYASSAAKAVEQAGSEAVDAVEKGAKAAGDAISEAASVVKDGAVDLAKDTWNDMKKNGMDSAYLQMFILVFTHA